MITGGQSYVSAPPAFSADGRSILICTGRVVSVFSTSTAMLVSELEGHEGDVTAVAVVAPPAAATAAAKLVSYCWTAGLDGVLIYWDFMAAEAVRKVQVGLPVHSMVVPNICRTTKGVEVPTPFAFVSVEDTSGLEGVIVVWQLDTGKRKFKPRLGSPLLFFAESPDSSISCVSCTSNQVYLLKMPNMEVIKSIAGIKQHISSPSLPASHRLVYGYDFTNRRIAIPTNDYCIQFYDLVENNEVSEVQICERNFQPVDDITMYISLVSLSIDGNLMCTVDVKLPEEELGGLVTLKFWNHGSNAGHYFLSTVIYEPHSDAGVSAVAFRPGRNMAVSSSLGGNFKVWVQSVSSQLSNERNNSGWRCQSVGSYKKKPMTAAAFSGDGSVLAVAAESVITLWDPDNNALVGIIAEALSPITNLSFVGTSAFLMSLSQSSRPQVAMWNVTNLSMHWSYSLFAEAACCSPDGTAFAVLTRLSCSAEQDGVLLLFDAENPSPVAYWSVKKTRGGSIAFVKGISLAANANDLRDEETLSLVYINSSHEYVVFDPQPTGYASIYGELPKLESAKGVSDIPFIPSDRPWETIFSGSSHVLPPLTKLCSTFLSSLLEKQTVANE
ncbi:hypothetical protein PR202_ga11893 [Eleusine coracana subsp. coracana]|uniref:WD repeat-containing protein 75 second beta-propeller domain-containing protein n=1 Tax=Eleusine coracana subsp. coracana TaxID=191504 RepID=A0AAV5CAP7_ELECO|nr:hypothetical protein PR202_ga11893 [Eleusine coracana subsp. coracana]